MISSQNLSSYNQIRQTENHGVLELAPIGNHMWNKYKVASNGQLLIKLVQIFIHSTEYISDWSNVMKVHPGITYIWPLLISGVLLMVGPLHYTSVFLPVSHSAPTSGGTNYANTTISLKTESTLSHCNLTNPCHVIGCKYRNFSSK